MMGKQRVNYCKSCEVQNPWQQIGPTDGINAHNCLLAADRNSHIFTININPFVLVERL